MEPGHYTFAVGRLRGLWLMVYLVFLLWWYHRDFTIDVKEKKQ